MCRIGINLANKVGHDSKFSIVAAQMDVKVLHGKGRSPPIARMTRNVIRVWKHGLFAILTAQRPVNIEEVQITTRSVEHLSRVIFAFGLSGDRNVKVEINRNPTMLVKRGLARGCMGNFET